MISPCGLAVEPASVLAVQPCFFSPDVLLAFLALLVVLLVLSLLVLTLVGS